MTAVEAVIDSILDQIEKHFCWDNLPIVASYLKIHPVHEDLNKLTLLLKEVFKSVYQLGFLVRLKHVHCLADRLNLFVPAKLDVPETNPFNIFLWQVICCDCLSSSGRSMLRHVSHSTEATATGIDFNTLNVLPERLRVQWRFKRAIVCNNAHLLKDAMLLDKYFELFVNKSSLLHCLHVAFVLFWEHSLRDEKVWKAIWEQVNLESDLIAWIASYCSRVQLWLLNDAKRTPLNDLWRLSDLRAIAAIHINQSNWPLAREKHFDRLNSAPHKFTFAKLQIFKPRHVPVTRKLLLLAAKVVATVLAQEILVTLEKVVDKVIHLRVVRSICAGWVTQLLLVAQRGQQMRLFNFF